MKKTFPGENKLTFRGNKVKFGKINYSLLLDLFARFYRLLLGLESERTPLSIIKYLPQSSGCRTE